MVATRGRTFKRPWRRSYHSSKLKSSSAPTGRKDSWCFHAVGSSNAPLLGSTAAEGLPRIGRTSIVSEIIAEGTLIAGWVAMWRPLDTFLYDWGRSNAAAEFWGSWRKCPWSSGLPKRPLRYSRNRANLSQPSRVAHWPSITILAWIALLMG